MKTPLGTVVLPAGWEETTITTLRLAEDDPAKGMAIVLKRLPAGADAARAFEDEKEGLKRTFGGALKVDGEQEVSFLGGKRPCLRYSFEVGGRKVTQALVVGAGKKGAFSATATALGTSFDKFWPSLKETIASFSPGARG